MFILGLVRLVRYEPKKKFTEGFTSPKKLKFLFFIDFPCFLPYFESFYIDLFIKRFKNRFSMKIKQERGLGEDFNWRQNVLTSQFCKKLVKIKLLTSHFGRPEKTLIIVYYYT